MQAALSTLQTSNPAGPVSAHYLIGANGQVLQLVDETQRAWHAGVAEWGGRGDLNSASIGIELDNDGQAPFADAQISALLALLDDLCRRLKISPQQIWAHGDVAPARKRDPHAAFPWRRLALAGFGLWPRAERAQLRPGFDPSLALRLIGYDLRDAVAAVRAFRRHYRGDEGEVLDAIDLSLLQDLQLQLLFPDSVQSESLSWFDPSPEADFLEPERRD